MAYQDRRGHVSGSTSDVAAGLCRRAFIQLHGATTASMRDHRGAHRSQRLPIPGQVPASLAIKNVPGLDDLTVNMETMSDIVSALVVLSCMDPKVTVPLRKVWSTEGTQTAVRDLCQEARGFTASAKLHNKFPEQRDGSRVQSSGLQRAGEHTVSNGVEELMLHNSKTREHVYQVAHRWAMEDAVIVVDCRRYTMVVLLACSTIVIGGLVARLLVGSRIDGVDPFNLTIFSWIIVAFYHPRCQKRSGCQVVVEGFSQGSGAMPERRRACNRKWLE